MPLRFIPITYKLCKSDRLDTSVLPQEIFNRFVLCHFFKHLPFAWINQRKKSCATHTHTDMIHKSVQVQTKHGEHTVPCMSIHTFCHIKTTNSNVMGFYVTDQHKIVNNSVVRKYYTGFKKSVECIFIHSCLLWKPSVKPSLTSCFQESQI